MGAYLILLCGLFIGLCTLLPFLEYRRMINFLKQKNIYREAIADFPVARPFMNNRIRLGDKFVFGGNYCTILRYTDISRIYQYVDKKSLFYGRQLHAFDISGKFWRLCSLRVLTENQPGLNDVLDFIMSKNPRVAIDYRQ